MTSPITLVTVYRFPNGHIIRRVVGKAGYEHWIEHEFGNDPDSSIWEEWIWWYDQQYPLFILEDSGDSTPLSGLVFNTAERMAMDPTNREDLFENWPKTHAKRYKSAWAPFLFQGLFQDPISFRTQFNLSLGIGVPRSAWSQLKRHFSDQGKLNQEALRAGSHRDAFKILNPAMTRIIRGFKRIGEEWITVSSRKKGDWMNWKIRLGHDVIDMTFLWKQGLWILRWDGNVLGESNDLFWLIDRMGWFYPVPLEEVGWPEKNPWWEDDKPERGEPIVDLELYRLMDETSPLMLPEDEFIAWATEMELPMESTP